MKNFDAAAQQPTQVSNNHKTTTDGKRNVCFDGLRGLLSSAVVVVVVF